MSNVHGLFSNKKDDDDSDDGENNNRYVGGVDSRGGGRYGQIFACSGKSCERAIDDWPLFSMCSDLALIDAMLSIGVLV